MTAYFVDGDAKMIRFERSPLEPGNINAKSERYDLDEGWVSNGDRVLGGVVHGSGDWDQIPEDYVQTQIEHMQARRAAIQRRNAAPPNP